MPSLPKILLVGGPDVDARLELMRSLSDHYEISALGSSSHLREKFVHEGFSYDSYTLNRGANPLTDLKSLFQLISIFRKFKPQIVHTFDTKPCVWGRIAAVLAGVPVVVGTLPGLGSLYVDKPLKSQVVRLMYQSLQRLSCHISDLTIFQNQDDADQFMKLGIVPARKVRVIYGSGVNTNLFSIGQVSEAAKTSLKNEFNIQPDEIVVTMISRVIRTKGVLDFMHSALEIQKVNPKLRFLLVGDEDKESLDRLTPDEISRLKLAVNWCGPRRDVPVILAITDIFVLPSTYREGIPRVLLEAASMELPIITTNSPGCKDVVENERNGFLIPPHDTNALSLAIRHLVGVPELRRRFGQLSRQKAIDQFDTSVIYRQTQIMYQHLIS